MLGFYKGQIIGIAQIRTLNILKRNGRERSLENKEMPRRWRKFNKDYLSDIFKVGHVIMAIIGVKLS